MEEDVNKNKENILNIFIKFLKYLTKKDHDNLCLRSLSIFIILISIPIIFFLLILILLDFVPLLFSTIFSFSKCLSIICTLFFDIYILILWIYIIDKYIDDFSSWF